MGKHWVPQKYLSGFASDEDATLIWQFDKRSRSFAGSPLPISNVAQQPAYNDDDTEQQLADQIEKPVNPILDELRAGKPLTDEHRCPLSIYMATMLHRVPAKREMAEQLYPEALSNVIDELKASVQAFGEEMAVAPEVIKRRLAEAEDVRKKFTTAKPKEAFDQIRSPWPAKEHIDLIRSMNWQIVEAGGSATFITSDNPFFFFSCYGLANADSEFTFPISPTLALFGSWRPRQWSRVYSSDYVTEANLRLACGAARFIFCHNDHDWVAGISDTRTEQLSRIV